MLSVLWAPRCCADEVSCAPPLPEGHQPVEDKSTAYKSVRTLETTQLVIQSCHACLTGKHAAGFRTVAETCPCSCRLRCAVDDIGDESLALRRLSEDSVYDSFDSLRPRIGYHSISAVGPELEVW